MAGEVQTQDKKPLSHSIHGFALFILIAGLLGALLLAFIFEAPHPYNGDMGFNLALWFYMTAASILLSIPMFFWSKHVRLIEALYRNVVEKGVTENIEKPMEPAAIPITQEIKNDMRKPGEPLF